MPDEIAAGTRWPRACCACATPATSTSSAAGSDAVLVDFGSGRGRSTGSTSSASSASPTCSSPTTTATRCRASRRAADAGDPHLGAAGRARPDRRRRRALAARGTLDNDYDLRQDRFSLLEQVPVAGVGRRVPAARATAASTSSRCRRPGHTPARSPTSSSSTGAGSRSPATCSTAPARSGRSRRRSGRTRALEGPSRRAVSCGARRPTASPTCCCPSHGEPIEDPPAAIALDPGARSRSCSTCAASGRGTSTPGCDHPWRARHAAPAAQPHAAFATQLRAALGDRRGAADRLRLRPQHRHARRRASGPPGGRCSPRCRRCAATSASSASRSSSRPTTTTTTSRGSTCCATCEGTEVWVAGERRAGARATRAPRPAVPLVRPGARRPGARRSASRSAWHEYELTVVPAARPHAATRRRSRSRSTAGACSPRGDQQQAARPATIAQLPVPQPLSTSTTTCERRALPAAAARAADQRPLGAARGRRRATSTGSLADGRAARRAAPRAPAARRGRPRRRGLRRAHRAVPLAGRPAARRLELEVSVRNPFDRAETRRSPRRARRLAARAARPEPRSAPLGRGDVRVRRASRRDAGAAGARRRRRHGRRASASASRPRRWWTSRERPRSSVAALPARALARRPRRRRRRRAGRRALAAPAPARRARRDGRARRDARASSPPVDDGDGVIESPRSTRWERRR